MPNGFDIPNQTIGGGSAWYDLLMRVMEELGQGRGVRAGLGSDLFSNLLNRQLEANRRPISLMDQLLLSREVGSVFPLSQASQEQLGRYSSRPQSNLMSDLQRRLGMFSLGALTPEQQVSEGFDPQTGIRLSERQRDYIRALAQQGGMEPPQFADEPRRMQFGGRLRIDPSRVVSTPSTVAGPASVVDRTGRRVALMGEAGQPETMTVGGGGVGGGVAATSGETAQGEGVFPEHVLAALPRDVRLRLEEFVAATGGLAGVPGGKATAMGIAQRPGDFEQWIGVQTPAHVELSRAIGGAIAGDQRFSPSMLRALAMGRTPQPQELTASDIANLPPDMQQMLISAIGPEQMMQFGFELGAFTPTGRRTGIAGPVQVAA